MNTKEDESREADVAQPSNHVDSIVEKRAKLTKAQPVPDEREMYHAEEVVLPRQVMHRMNMKKQVVIPRAIGAFKKGLGRSKAKLSKNQLSMKAQAELHGLKQEKSQMDLKYSLKKLPSVVKFDSKEMIQKEKEKPDPKRHEPLSKMGLFELTKQLSGRVQAPIKSPPKRLVKLALGLAHMESEESFESGRSADLEVGTRNETARDEGLPSAFASPRTPPRRGGEARGFFPGGGARARTARAVLAGSRGSAQGRRPAPPPSRGQARSAPPPGGALARRRTAGRHRILVQPSPRPPPPAPAGPSSPAAAAAGALSRWPSPGATPRPPSALSSLVQSSVGWGSVGGQDPLGALSATSSIEGAGMELANKPKESKPKTQMEYERGVTLSILDLINEETMEELKMAFESSPSHCKLTRSQFVQIMISVLKRDSSSVDFALQSNKLFDCIDLNRKGSITWDNFTDFIVESAFDSSKLTEQELLKYNHVCTWDTAERIERLYYFDVPTNDNWSIMVVLKSDKNEFRIWMGGLDSSKQVLVENGQPLSADLTKEGISSYKMAVSTIDCSIVLYDITPLAGAIHRDPKRMRAQEIQTCVRFTQRFSGFLFSGGMSGRVLKWDYTKGEILSAHDGHTESISVIVEITADENIATGSYDGKIKVWDIETGRGQRFYPAHRRGVLSLAYAAQHCLLCSSGLEKDVKVWNPFVGGQLICTLSGHTTQVVSVAVATRTPEILSLGIDGHIKVWDIRDLSEAQSIKLDIGTNEVKDLCFVERNGYNRIVVLQGRKLELFDTQSTEKAEAAKEKAHASTVLFHSDSNSIITACDEGVSLYSADTGCLLTVHSEIHEHNSEITTICLDVTKRRLIAGFSNGALKVYDLLSGHFLEALDSHTTEIVSLHIHTEESEKETVYGAGAQSETKNYVVSCSKCGMIRAHELGKAQKGGRRRRTTQHVYKHTIAMERLRQQGRHEASSNVTAEPSPQKHNKVTQSNINQKEAVGAPGPSRAAAASASAAASVGSFRGVRGSRRSTAAPLARAQAEAPLRRPKNTGPKQPEVDVRRLACSPALGLLATSTFGGAVVVWDAKKVREITPLTVLECHAYQISSLCFMDPFPVLISADLEGRIVFTLMPPCQDAFQPLYEFTNSTAGPAALKEDSEEEEEGEDNVDINNMSDKHGKAVNGMVNNAVAVQSIFWNCEPDEGRYQLLTGDAEGYCALWDAAPLVRAATSPEGGGRLPRAALPPGAEGRQSETERASELSQVTAASFFLTGVDAEVEGMRIDLLKQWQAHDSAVCLVQMVSEQSVFVRIPQAPPKSAGALGHRSLNATAHSKALTTGKVDHSFIVTSGFDATVKLWSPEGAIVGTLQEKMASDGDNVWRLHNSSDNEFGNVDSETHEQILKMLESFQEDAKVSRASRERSAQISSGLHSLSSSRQRSQSTKLEEAVQRRVTALTEAAAIEGREVYQGRTATEVGQVVMSSLSAR